MTIEPQSIEAELHGRGWLADHLYKGWCAYGERLRLHEPEIIAGYHTWGVP